MSEPIAQGPILRKVFICNNGKCTSAQDAQVIYETLTEMIHERGMDKFDAPVRVKCLLTGCLDICKNGPVMVVHPGAVFYQHVDLPALQCIFEQHLLHGVVVDEYVFHRDPAVPGVAS